MSNVVVVVGQVKDIDIDIDMRAKDTKIVRTQKMSIRMWLHRTNQ